MRAYLLVCGIDIAALSASVAIGKWLSEDIRLLDIKQTPREYQKLHNRLKRYSATPPETLVVMEATGTYWMNLALYLSRQGYVVSVVNPSTAYYFAKSMLKRDKNDLLDAKILLELGMLHHAQLPIWREPPAVYEAIHQRLTQRDAFVHMKVQTQNRSHALAHRTTQIEAVAQRNDDLISYLEEQIACVEQELKQLYLADHEWSLSAQRLLSIKGIGVVTAGWILVATQNFQTFDTAEQASSFAGLVPRQRQSGTSLKGKNEIGHAGHERLRRAMFMAAKSASQHNLHIKPFYKRLKKKDKLSNVATIAAARKLMHICWACVKHERMYDPNY